MIAQTVNKTSSGVKRYYGYGITEKKKAELDGLTLEVLDAQHDVDQYQAIVTALTLKLNNFQGFLATADNNRTKALNNKNMISQLVQSALDLKNNSSIAFNEMVLADSRTKDLANTLKDVMDKLIYSAEIINKLANLVVSRKALNPLISDELVSMIGKAGSDANSAVSLTLIALQSTFAAQASNMESEAATALEFTQAMALYQTLTGKDINGNSTTSANNPASLNELLDNAYTEAKSVYEKTHEACNVTTQQLNSATTLLNKAQVKLKSLQSGLVAANAAALAS